MPGWTRNYNWGTLELIWSPSCRTNWTRFTPGFSGAWDVNVERAATSTETHLRVQYPTYELQAGIAHYTDMVYAPGPAQACADNIDGDVGACTGYTS